MDLGTIIIGTIGVALCSLPFVLTNLSKKKREKELVQTLKELAKQNGSEITQHETCGFYAIGIDERKNSVSFVANADDETTQQFINLSSIKSCKIQNISKLTTDNEKIIDRLQLNFQYFDKKKRDIILEFYNSDINFLLTDEFDSIEKWETIINNMLKNNQQKIAA